MRLRHKKNAESDILTHSFIVQNNIGGELCEPSKIFGNDNPINLELGMGKGKFITEMSKIHFDINYIGIEKSATIVLKAIDNLTIGSALDFNPKENIIGTDNKTVGANLRSPCRGEHCEPAQLCDIYTNLRFMCMDIENLDKVFAEHSIDKIYLNFSDPWPKKRHESRRLTHSRFLKIYEKLLKPNSLLEFKTDNKDLFDFSLEEIRNSNFELLEFTYDLHNDKKLNEGNIMTEYEAKFSKLGNKICKLIALAK